MTIGTGSRPTFLWLVTGVTGVIVGFLAWDDGSRSQDSLAAWISMIDAVVLSRAGGADVASIWIDQQWWRLATACLLHGGLFHWLVNIISLHALWPWSVAAVGQGRSVGVLISGGIVATLASSYAGEGAVVVGLSGGLFALAAVVVNERGGVCAEVRRQVVTAVVVCMVAGWVLPMVWASGPRLANTGHAAGWVVGGVWVLGLERSATGRRMDGRVALHLGVAGATLAVVLSSHGTLFSSTLGLHLLQQGRPLVAVGPLEDSYQRRPEAPERANALAYALALTGERLDEASALSANALSQDPKNSSYLDTRGWVLCRLGEVERGLRLLGEARTLDQSEDPTIQEHLQSCAGAVLVRAVDAGQSATP